MKQNTIDIMELVGGFVFVTFMFAVALSGGEIKSVDYVTDAITPTQEMVIYKPPTPTQYTSKGKFITHCTITVYHPVAKECNSDPTHTANNTKIDFDKLKKGEVKYCAISRDLLWKIPMESTIHIEGHGYYYVCDLMNSRFTHAIDIMRHPSDRELFKHSNVRVTLL